VSFLDEIMVSRTREWRTRLLVLNCTASDSTGKVALDAHYALQTPEQVASLIQALAASQGWYAAIYENSAPAGDLDQVRHEVRAELVDESAGQMSDNQGGE
jgi:hypothetical protein